MPYHGSRKDIICTSVTEETHMRQILPHLLRSVTLPLHTSPIPLWWSQYASHIDGCWILSASDVMFGRCRGLAGNIRIGRKGKAARDVIPATY